MNHLLVLGLVIGLIIVISAFGVHALKHVKEMGNKKTLQYYVVEERDENKEEETHSENEEAKITDENDKDDDLHYTEITGMSLPSKAEHKITKLCTLSVQDEEEGCYMLIPQFQNVIARYVGKKYPEEISDKMKFKLHMYDLNNYHDGKYVIIEAVEKQKNSLYGGTKQSVFLCNVTTDDHFHDKIILRSTRFIDREWKLFRSGPETKITDDRFFQMVQPNPKKPDHYSFFHLNANTYLTRGLDVLNLVAITGEMGNRSIFKVTILE